MTRRISSLSPLPMLMLWCLSLWLFGQVEAYPSRAGTCATGPSIGTDAFNLHGTDGSGSLGTGGIQVMVNAADVAPSPPLDETTSAPFSVPTDSLVNITLRTTLDFAGEGFKGFLVRLQDAAQEVDLSSSLQLVEDFPGRLMESTDLERSGPSATCGPGVAGFCHAEREPKTITMVRWSTAGIPVDTEIHLEVTVVVSNDIQGGIGNNDWHYSDFFLVILPRPAGDNENGNAASDRVDAPTSSPTAILTNLPTAVPTMNVATTNAPTSMPAAASTTLPTMSPTLPTMSPTSLGTSPAAASMAPVMGGNNGTATNTTTNTTVMPSSIPTMSPTLSLTDSPTVGAPVASSLEPTTSQQLDEDTTTSPTYFPTPFLGDNLSMENSLAPTLLGSDSSAPSTQSPTVGETSSSPSEMGTTLGPTTVPTTRLSTEPATAVDTDNHTPSPTRDETPVPTNQQEDEEEEDCFDSTLDILEAELLASMVQEEEEDDDDDNDDDKVRLYTLCSNRMYNISSVWNDMPPLYLFQSNIHIRCAKQNCILTTRIPNQPQLVVAQPQLLRKAGTSEDVQQSLGFPVPEWDLFPNGTLHHHDENDDDDENDTMEEPYFPRLRNIVLEGLTFTSYENDSVANAYVYSPSDVTFRDCIFRDNDNPSVLVIADPTSKLSSEAAEENDNGMTSLSSLSSTPSMSPIAPVDASTSGERQRRRRRRLSFRGGGTARRFLFDLFDQDEVTTTPGNQGEDSSDDDNDNDNDSDIDIPTVEGFGYSTLPGFVPTQDTDMINNTNTNNNNNRTDAAPTASPVAFNATTEEEEEAPASPATNTTEKEKGPTSSSPGTNTTTNTTTEAPAPTSSPAPTLDSDYQSKKPEPRDSTIRVLVDSCIFENNTDSDTSAGVSGAISIYGTEAVPTQVRIVDSLFRDNVYDGSETLTDGTYMVFNANGHLEVEDSCFANNTISSQAIIYNTFSQYESNNNFIAGNIVSQASTSCQGVNDFVGDRFLCDEFNATSCEAAALAKLNGQYVPEEEDGSCRDNPNVRFRVVIEYQRSWTCDTIRGANTQHHRRFLCNNLKRAGKRCPIACGVCTEPDQETFVVNDVERPCLDKTTPHRYRLVESKGCEWVRKRQDVAKVRRFCQVFDRMRRLCPKTCGVCPT